MLISVQAALVVGLRPILPAALRGLRSSAWAWALLPVSLGGTIAILAAVPSLAQVYAWVAAIGVPILAAVALGAALRPRGRAVSLVVGLAAAAGLLAVAWAGEGLAAQGAAVALTALSASTLASYLAQLAPSVVLRVALVAMAVLDAILVFGHLLEGPNQTLNAAGAGASLPHFQVAVFGHALIGYGDLFVAAVLGCVLAEATRPAWPARWVGAVVVLALSALFDLLFLVVDSLPATVPVAVALLIFEADRVRKRRRRRS
ncbi:hypothetical protein [Nocardioides sp.]|uniref:hypothetical protein n=1 Tax=Nocardioides sp. TaxID=35761 RepID=UPI00263A3792|nr:hypothetical protein [Nocardioides sp.]